MSDLAFSGSGYEPPVGVVALSFGDQGGTTGPYVPPVGLVDLQFEEALEPTFGTANLKFGESGGVVTGDERFLVVNGVIPRPQSSISADFARQLVVNADTISPVSNFSVSVGVGLTITASAPAPEAFSDVTYNINVDRDPKSMIRMPTFSQAASDKYINRVENSWKDSTRLRPLPGSSWQTAQNLTDDIRQGFRDSQRVKNINNSKYEFAEKLQQSNQTNYEYAARLKTSDTSKYEFAKGLQSGSNANFEYATRTNATKEYKNGIAGFVPYTHRDSFTQAEPFNKIYVPPYEEATLPLWGTGVVIPPVEPPEPPNPIYNPDLVFCIDPSVINLNPLVFGRDYCAYQPPLLIPVRRIYTVANSAQIVRVSDGRDIPATSVTLSCDMDNFAWEMSASIIGRDAAALVEGTDAEPVEVDVVINGNTWRVLVDSWSLREAAVSTSGSISGRSRSAYLAAPYYEKRDYVESQQRLMAQLAAQELPFGWNMNWSAVDWLVPAEAWQYQKLAPMNAIAQLASAAAAFVYTDPLAQEIYVKPRYPVSPWDWATETPLIQLPKDVMFQRSSQKTPGTGVNAAWVQGNVGGVLAKVKRTGSAGNVLAPTVVNDLVSDTISARALGIEAIANTARQSIEQYEMPLANSFGGLRTPGELIAIGSGDSPFVGEFNGLIKAVSVSANAERASNGGAALKVRQAFSLQRYFGEPIP